MAAHRQKVPEPHQRLVLAREKEGDIFVVSVKIQGRYRKDTGEGHGVEERKGGSFVRSAPFSVEPFYQKKGTSTEQRINFCILLGGDSGGIQNLRTPNGIQAGQITVDSDESRCPYTPSFKHVKQIFIIENIQ